MLTENKDLINKEFKGYMFEKIKRNDDLFQYMVYIEDLNMVKRYTSRHDIPNETSQIFKLYIFSDEIRAQKNSFRVNCITYRSQSNHKFHSSAYINRRAKHANFSSIYDYKFYKFFY